VRKSKEIKNGNGATQKLNNLLKLVRTNRKEKEGSNQGADDRDGPEKVYA